MSKTKVRRAARWVIGIIAMSCLVVGCMETPRDGATWASGDGAQLFRGWVKRASHSAGHRRKLVELRARLGRRPGLPLECVSAVRRPWRVLLRRPRLQRRDLPYLWRQRRSVLRRQLVRQRRPDVLGRQLPGVRWFRTAVLRGQRVRRQRSDLLGWHLPFVRRKRRVLLRRELRRRQPRMPIRQSVSRRRPVRTGGWCVLPGQYFT